MKKILLEYSNIIAYTVTGLVFGLAFFLLFINLYHMEELSETVDISTYNENVKNNVSLKVQTIKDNLSVYKQSDYRGSLNIFALNTAQSKMQSCIKIIESEDMMRYFDIDELTIGDSYDFVVDYNNKILNDCLVMQIISLINSDVIETIPSINLIKPYIQNNIKNLLETVTYIQNNILNSDHYYFTTDINKNNLFNLAEDSYTNVMNSYLNSLDLLVELSTWYKNVVIGG